MQIVFSPEVDAGEYQRQGKDFNFPDLTKTLCPLCHAEHLKKHGYYKRYLIIIGFMGLILIRRYKCQACGRTVSLLPSFAHPGRTYGITSIIGVLMLYYAECRCVMDSVRICKARHSVDCSRQLLRHFRKRFEGNLPALVDCTNTVFSLRGPPDTGEDIKKRGKQYLKCAQRLNPEDVSKKLFERSRMTYLSPLPSSQGYHP